jgi:hypothetical protein
VDRCPLHKARLDPDEDGINRCVVCGKTPAQAKAIDREIKEIRQKRHHVIWPVEEEPIVRKERKVESIKVEMKQEVKVETIGKYTCGCGREFETLRKRSAHWRSCPKAPANYRGAKVSQNDPAAKETAKTPAENDRIMTAFPTWPDMRGEPEAVKVAWLNNYHGARA